MAVLLWICSLVVMGLILAAWREGRDQAPDRWWSYPVQPALAPTAATEPGPGPGPLTRPSPRPALQTGVAILAVALAIDVSNAPLFQLAPLEPEPAASLAASSPYDTMPGQDGVAVYAPVSWTMSSTATDGWFV